jgi:hypothetical protein
LTAWKCGDLLITSIIKQVSLSVWMPYRRSRTANFSQTLELLELVGLAQRAEQKAPTLLMATKDG